MIKSCPICGTWRYGWKKSMLIKGIRLQKHFAIQGEQIECFECENEYTYFPEAEILFVKHNKFNWLQRLLGKKAKNI
jgi:predicted nucleic-acid-binding Zn-ribbon protein